MNATEEEFRREVIWLHIWRHVCKHMDCSPASFVAALHTLYLLDDLYYGGKAPGYWRLRPHRRGQDPNI